MTYNLEIIPGTRELVEKELLQLFTDAIIINSSEKNISFSHPNDDIDTFQVIRSALRIKKENGLVRNLFRREWRKEVVPAGINPALAYVMCMFAEIQDSDVILDPFCGGGTIAITAVVYFKPKKVLCSDKSGTAIDKTIINIEQAHVKKGKIIAFRSNISQLRLQKNSVTKIITNLPFGVRVGSHSENAKIYRELFQKAKTILTSQGELVILTQEKDLLESCSHEFDFTISESLLVRQGGLYPSLYKIKKSLKPFMK